MCRFGLQAIRSRTRNAREDTVRECVTTAADDEEDDDDDEFNVETAALRESRVYLHTHSHRYSVALQRFGNHFMVSTLVRNIIDILMRARKDIYVRSVSE